MAAFGCLMFSVGDIPCVLRRVCYNPGRLVAAKPRVPISYMLASKMHQSTGENTSQIRRAKLWKRLFSSALFGATLGTAVYIKRKKTADLKNLLRDCKRLPIDEHYENKDAQHMYLYNGYVLHLSHLKALREMSAFQARDDDIYVISFPKSGTTWVQEIVYLIETNLNYKEARSQILETRFPYLEHVYPGWKSLKKSQKRFIKTHLPYSLLPSSIKDNNSKIIYVARNPKDTLVSYYYYVRMMTFASYKGTLQDFFKKFLNNEVFYAPFWNHVLEFWSRRENDKILFIKYEDLQKDVINEIKRIAAFLDRSLTDDQLKVLAHHVSFNQMAKNPSVNYEHWDDLGLRHRNECLFFRRGAVGDWKNHLSKDMNDTIDDWINLNAGESDLKFDYE